MAELIEYVVVFGISAGLAGASVALVSGALPGLAEVAAASKSDQLAGAARVSLVEGKSVTVVLPVRGAAVSCVSGELSVYVGAYSRSYELGAPCAFSMEGLTGVCAFSFAPTSSDALDLEVKC